MDSGSVALPCQVQFGHAGARARGDEETAGAKNRALRQAGAVQGLVVSNRGLIGLTKGSQWLTTCRWWQLNYFWTFSPPKIGEDEPILTSTFFQRGWFNHQLDSLFSPLKRRKKRTDTPFETRGETNPHWAGVSNMGFGGREITTNWKGTSVEPSASIFGLHINFHGCNIF